jgi:hypothetical protein
MTPSNARHKTKRKSLFAMANVGFADLIIHNANVYTVDPARPTAAAVAVAGREIIAVGSEAEVLAWQGAKTRRIDGQGGTLLPGFIDSHFHLLSGSLTLNDMQLAGVTSLEALTTAVQSFKQSRPERAWYVGYGLAYNLLPQQQGLTRQHLDAIEAERPLVLIAFDFHSAWANSAALRQLGWLEGGPAEYSEQIVRGEDGQAQGMLLELSHAVLDHLPRPDFAQIRAALREGLAVAASLGITSVHNMDGNLERIGWYAAMEDLAELTLRVYCPYDITPDTRPEDLAEAITMRKQFRSDMVRSGCVKFFMDGVIESGTAFVLQDYVLRPGHRGNPLYSAGHFAEMATAADALGLQIFVHAVGDAAVRRTLDGLALAQEANGRRDSRHRIEHIELLHPDDGPRFAELGVIASMQPLHAPLAPLAEPDAWAAQLGPARWDGAFPWRTLRQAGAQLIFGSDWPVASQNPLAGLAAAVTRQPLAGGQRDERQTLAEAIAAYTRDAAYAEFQEGKKGQIKAGLWADLVLLDQDIFAIPPEEIATVRPRLTLCNGRVVYGAGA